MLFFKKVQNLLERFNEQRDHQTSEMVDSFSVMNFGTWLSIYLKTAIKKLCFKKKNFFNDKVNWIHNLIRVYAR